MRDGKLLETIKISESNFWECEALVAPGRHTFAFRSDVPLRVRRFDCTTTAGPLPVEFERGNAQDASNEVSIAFDNTEDRALSVKLSAWVHDAPDLAHSRARYKLEVEAVDKAFGELVAELKRRNLYDHTVIAFTADHGEALGDHGRVGHTQSLYDETLRVPLIIKPVKGDLRITDLAHDQHNLVRHIDGYSIYSARLPRRDGDGEPPMV